MWFSCYKRYTLFIFQIFWLMKGIPEKLGEHQVWYLQFYYKNRTLFKDRVSCIKHHIYTEWMSEWLLINATWGIFHIHHAENKLHLMKRWHTLLGHIILILPKYSPTHFFLNAIQLEGLQSIKHRIHQRTVSTSTVCQAFLNISENMIYEKLEDTKEVIRRRKLKNR